MDFRTVHRIQRVSQVAAWLLTLAIVALSLGPPSTRPVTGAGHSFEHLLIFLATGAGFGLGYPRRFGLLAIALPIFATGIEIAQIWVPGRHPRLIDFLVDAAALYLGLGLSSLLLRPLLMRSGRRNRPHQGGGKL